MGAKLMPAHHHIEGLLQNVEAHRTVEGVLDLPENVQVNILVGLVFIRY